MGISILTEQWQRDANFDYERLNPSYGDSDSDIDELRTEPSPVERALRRVMRVLNRRKSEPTSEPVALPGETLHGIDFCRRRLDDSDFTGADLQFANFVGARLTRCQFENADMRNANMAEADFSGADMRGADMRGANLIGANFSGADLRRANLSGAYIWGADFNDADLHDTDLTGAYAGGALFSHARNLTLEQFRSTIHDETGAYRLSMLPNPPASK